MSLLEKFAKSINLTRGQPSSSPKDLILRCSLAYVAFGIFVRFGGIPTPLADRLGWHYYALFAVPFVLLYVALRLSSQVTVEEIPNPIPWSSYSWKKKIWVWIKTNF